MATINVLFSIPQYGYVEVTTAALDAAMSHYLPSSLAQLREICEYRSDPITFGQVTDVSTFLAILADMDYNTDEYAGTDLCTY